MSEPRSTHDARIDALFQAAREAPIPAAPAFERVRRRSTFTVQRWAVGWALLPVLAGAAVGSYVVVKAKLAPPKETPAPVKQSAPAVLPPAQAKAPEPLAVEAPKELVAPVQPPPAVHAPVAHPPARDAQPPAKPIARLGDSEPEPAPPVPAVGGPAPVAETLPPAPSTLAEQSRLVREGYDALNAGHPTDARDRFDEYRRRFPGGVLEAEALLGSIRADQALGLHSLALESIDRAVQLAPERRAELTVLQGELLLASGRRDAARDAFDRALAFGLSPDLLDRATRGRAAAK